MRKIIHIDMDAFFASVEQRDFPQYRGKPLAVGSSSKRGVVAAASYEARKYGVHSAMPSSIAIRKCPQLIFAKSRFDVYKEVSQQIRSVFSEYTDLIEPLSLDEAYLDVTENKVGIRSATFLAKEIKRKIKDKTQLTASAGVSFNKFLAKVASDMDKPNGIYVITPDKAESFLENLPIEKFHGIGKVTAQKMKMVGIHLGKDLKKWQQENLIERFGKSGLYYYKIVRAIDNREVNPHKIRKSIGAERTFSDDISTLQELQNSLNLIVEEVCKRAHKSQMFGRTFTLKVKFNDFQQITRSKSVDSPLKEDDALKLIAENLLTDTYSEIDRGVRLLGFSISNLESNTLTGKQLNIPFKDF